jgi:hypothetical protein
VRPPLIFMFLPSKSLFQGVEPRGFEPLTSAVQMRLDESASVRIRPESAANTYILTIGVGWSIRPVSSTTAWVGVGLVSNLTCHPQEGIRFLKMADLKLDRCTG